VPRYQGIPWSLRVPWNAKWPQLIAVSLSNRPPQRIAQAILNICGRKDLDELALEPGQAEGQISWPGQNDLRPGTITNNRHAAAGQETTFRNPRDPQLRVIDYWPGD